MAVTILRNHLGGPEGKPTYESVTAAFDAIFDDSRIPAIEVPLLGRPWTMRVGRISTRGVPTPDMGENDRANLLTWDGVEMAVLRQIGADALHATRVEFSDQALRLRVFTYGGGSVHRMTSARGDEMGQLKGEALTHHYGWMALALTNVPEFNPDRQHAGITHIAALPVHAQYEVYRAA